MVLSYGYTTRFIPTVSDLNFLPGVPALLDEMQVDAGLLIRADDPSHKQKAIYSLTEMSITLVPVLTHLGTWGRRYLKSSRELSLRAQLLEEGAPQMWEQVLDELCVRHLDKRAIFMGPSVALQLQSAYEAVLCRK